MLRNHLHHLCTAALLLILLLLGGCKTTEEPTPDDAEQPSVTAMPDVSVSPAPSLPEGATLIPYLVQTDVSSLDSSYAISELLFGIFLEDINFAVDGGMYAELLPNRSFEYGELAADGYKHAWNLTAQAKSFLSFTVVDGREDHSALNENNPHYAVLTNRSENPYGIYNLGYLDGIAVTSGTEYRFSVYLKTPEEYDGEVTVTIDDRKTVYASGTITGLTSDWNKYELSLVPEADGLADGTVLSSNIRLTMTITEGTVHADMISLMTTDTYRGTDIRRDIGEALEALHPSFLRFPGGCVIEGNDVESMYRWKDSIGNGLSFMVNGEITVGDAAARPQGRSVWNGSAKNPYYTTHGIGFYEYFELCELLDCVPLPVLNAGTTCQLRSPEYIVYDVNSAAFLQCVQDALDLVEFCRGDASTEWGGVRIAMGHEEPFPLKYIAIGNEQWQSEYFQHYQKFEEAFAAAAKDRPELFEGIELVVANGTSSFDTYGWNYVKQNASDLTTLVDEHYYEPPLFFFTNTGRYSSYDRTLSAKVFLGEYASLSNKLESALSEAAFMTGLEKNGDVVALACYAPLFGNRTQNQWAPNLIWFDHSTVHGSINYYVQQLFSLHRGIWSLPSELDLSSIPEEPLSGKVGLGTWQTSAAFDNLTVTDNTTGELLYACTFDDESSLTEDGFLLHNGSWAVRDGRLIQSHKGTPNDSNTGDAVYVGDPSWSNYTMTVEAEILSGSEGFLIPVCVRDTDNQLFWNLGGWGNTVSCLQIVSDGTKSEQVSGTTTPLSLEHNRVYTIRVTVNGRRVRCFLDDTLYIDHLCETTRAAYESACVAKNGDLILKLINTTDSPLVFQTALSGFDASAYDIENVQVTVLAGTFLDDANTFSEPEQVVPQERTMAVSEEFFYEAPAYSLSVIRIPTKDRTHDQGSEGAATK